MFWIQYHSGKPGLLRFTVGGRQLWFEAPNAVIDRGNIEKFVHLAIADAMSEREKEHRELASMTGAGPID